MEVLIAIMVALWVWLIIELVDAPVMDDDGNYK